MADVNEEIIIVRIKNLFDLSYHFCFYPFYLGAIFVRAEYDWKKVLKFSLKERNF